MNTGTDVENLIRRTAKRFAWTRLGEDLTQAGWEGVMRALGSFDPSRGAPFEAHAARHVLAAMMECARQFGTFRPRGVKARSLWPRIRAARATLISRGVESPTATEIALEIGVPEGDIEEVIQGEALARSASFEALLSEGFDVEGESLSPEQATERTRALTRLENAVDILRAELDPKDRVLLDEGLLCEEPLSFRELAKLVGLKSPASVGKRLTGIRARLARILGQGLFD